MGNEIFGPGMYWRAPAGLRIPEISVEKGTEIKHQSNNTSQIKKYHPPHPRKINKSIQKHFPPATKRGGPWGPSALCAQGPQPSLFLLDLLTLGYVNSWFFLTFDFYCVGRFRLGDLWTFRLCDFWTWHALLTFWTCGLWDLWIPGL